MWVVCRVVNTKTELCKILDKFIIRAVLLQLAMLAKPTPQQVEAEAFNFHRCHTYADFTWSIP